MAVFANFAIFATTTSSSHMLRKYTSLLFWRQNDNFGDIKMSLCAISLMFILDKPIQQL
ncbi:hypothetical protein HMPREF1581_00308 [Gardnerella vaginalis JCP8108]|uniref:Uncharacterized protein n=1 Tax=Gardnerella vaginalis JCP8108 TaxID=1261066 RepID=S4I4L3_GARVA|nr:hypothetical protein HMPREF1581_00308 [Gardnerella vaginalis JCP8108]